MIIKPMRCTWRWIILLLAFHAQAQVTDPVAENMLIYQRSSGGWAKQFGISVWPVDYTKKLTPQHKRVIMADEKHYEATIDNDATIPEIRYLVNAYSKTHNKAYLDAAEKGVRYLLKAQYDNGGWPQFYPLKKGYYSHITYNDNAMIHTITLLRDVASGAKGFQVVDKSLAPEASQAVQKGIDCILKTQVKVNGLLTVWCAQYDEHTLQPAPARAFELVSLSGLESVGLVSFLMTIKHPSPAIRESINGAIAWFNRSKIEGYDFVIVKDSGSYPEGRDAVLVPKPGSAIWARFYDIQTNKPFFTGKDGIARDSVSQIEHERRIKYSWYGKWAEKLLQEEYPRWLSLSHAGQQERMVKDIDGNRYHTTKIGKQTWMVENLKVSHYNNGDPIPGGINDNDWYLLEKGACTNYLNSTSLVSTYGKLYNWYAVTDTRGLCPGGWHVATEAEWNELETCLGGRERAGEIKAVDLWDPPNGGAVNKGGFSALPGGLRNFYGAFSSMGTFGYYWTSTSTPVGTALLRKFACYNTKVTHDDALKQTGFSCRCVLD